MKDARHAAGLLFAAVAIAATVVFAAPAAGAQAAKGSAKGAGSKGAVAPATGGKAGTIPAAGGAKGATPVTGAPASHGGRPWVGKSTGKGQPFTSGKKRDRAIPESASDLAAAGLAAGAAADEVAADAHMLLGDRVTGRLDRDHEITITFDAVEGTTVRFDVDLSKETLPAGVPEAADVLVARLHAPDGSVVAPFTREGSRHALEVVLEHTGTHAIRVSLDRRRAASFVLQTAGAYPDRIELELRLEHGRPERLTIGGMEGRRLKRAVINRRGTDDLDLAAQVLAPTGEYLDLAANVLRSTDGERLTLEELPLDENHDYLLYVADANRSGGTVRVSLAFENAPSGGALHVIDPLDE